MKKIVFISAIACSAFSTNILAASNHGGHGGGGSATGRACLTTAISHTKPNHLDTVAPQSEISFWVKGIKDPTIVEVTAKKLPITLTVEDKKHFFLFKGTLPDSLVATAARIEIKVHHKKCPASKGWLLKISE